MVAVENVLVRFMYGSDRPDDRCVFFQAGHSCRMGAEVKCCSEEWAWPGGGGGPELRLRGPTAGVPTD